MKKRIIRVIVAVAAVASLGQTVTVFDSVAEFSGTQGQSNWYFGYYDGDNAEPYTTSDFEQFPQFNGASWIILREGYNNGYWTSMGSLGGHPNGPVANYYLGTEHWSVRRWVSDVSGTILIEGLLFKNSTAGDGTIGSITVNDSLVYSKHIYGTEGDGVNYSVQVDVCIGDIIDFAIQPVAYDMYDSTRFTAVGTLLTPLAPTACSAINITDSQFVARWSAVSNATSYALDVSESTNFTACTGVYSNWNAGGATTCLVTGLVDGVTYWYRVRAANEYGPSPDSNVIEVPVSANTPYVKQEITNGVASAGSSDIVILSDLFHGIGKSYQIISNSNPRLVTASIDAEDGTLTVDYADGLSGNATITVREWMNPDFTGFYVDNPITVFVTAAQPACSTSPVQFNLANGLFEQVINVANTSEYDARAVSLTVSNLTAGAELYNATGSDSFGNPEILWGGALASGESMDFTLQYYTAAMGVTPTGTVSVALSLERPDAELEEENQIELIGTVQSGAIFVIAFNAVVGETYYIQYADSPAGPWKTANQPITAVTDQIQWVDAGPPVTESAGSSRVYRVIHND